MRQQTTKAYSINLFCDVYSISRRKFYQEVAAGRIRIRKLGKKTLIDANDAERWFSSLPTNKTVEG